MLIDEILKKLKDKHPNANPVLLNVIATNLAKGVEKIEDLKEDDLASAVKSLEDISKAFAPKPDTKKDDPKPEDAKTDEQKRIEKLEALVEQLSTDKTKNQTADYVTKLADEFKLKSSVVSTLVKGDITADNYDEVKTALEGSIKEVSAAFGGAEYVPQGEGSPDAATAEAQILADIEKYG